MDILIYSIVSLITLMLIMLMASGYYKGRKNRLVFVLIGILIFWMFYEYNVLLRSTHMDHSDLVDLVDVMSSYIF